MLRSLAPSKTTEERNALFASLSPIDCRKAIAYDVLYLLDNEEIVPTHGVYLAVNHFVRQSRTSDVEELLSRPYEVCNCCAKGAMFLSAVRKFNGAAGESMYDIESTVFGRTVANRIESLFEGCRCRSADEILRAIMKAIIADPDGLLSEKSAEAIEDWDLRGLYLP